MRIRTIKPELWSSTPFIRCSLRARLLFVGLLNYADDEGRGRADPALVRANLYPLELEEVSDADVLEWLRELHRRRLVDLYRAAPRDSSTGRGRSSRTVELLQVRGFEEHQVVSHPRESRYPPPRKAPRDSGNRSGKRSRKSSVLNGSGMEQGKGMEGNAGTAPGIGAGSTPNGAGAYDPDAVGPAPYDEPIPELLEATPDPEEERPRARPITSYRDRPNPWEDLEGSAPMTRGEEILRLEIPDVEPLPWPRSRVSRSGKFYLPKTYVAFRDLVAVHLGAAHRGPLEAGPLRLVLGFYRTSRRKADVDNLAKSVLDAGTGTVWEDDSQILDLHAQVRHRDAGPSIELLVYRLEEIESVSSERLELE